MRLLPFARTVAVNASHTRRRCRRLGASTLMVAAMLCSAACGGGPADCQKLSPANPYASGSGHSAGFEWAERKDPARCGGNSASFIAGCEEYLRQSAAYEACVNKQ
jgi:hypothetical protein